MFEPLVLSAHPLEALLQLEKAARDGRQLVVMTADLRLDPDLRDETGEHLDPRDHQGIDRRALTLLQAKRGEVRVLGPASGGYLRGPGKVALISQMGPAFPALAERLGPHLGLGIDLGLGWDMVAGELLTWVADETGENLHTVVLVLPPSSPEASPEAEPAHPWSHLALGLAALIDRGLTVLAVATGPDADALALHGVETSPDLGSLLARAMVEPKAGPLAVISTMGTDTVVDGLIDSFGLELADLAEKTLLTLERELPRATRLGAHLKIPNPSARHLQVARQALSEDPAVGAVWLAVGDPDPWASARAFAACVKKHTPIPREPSEPRQRVMAELMGLRLMKRLELDRDQVVRLLAINSAPTWMVTSLAAAHDAAGRIGYPVRLSPSQTEVPDRDALTLAWETLLADQRELVPNTHPRGPRDTDDWRPRRLLPAVPTVQASYRAHPLPFATIDGHRVAMPCESLATRHSLGRPELVPLLRALSELAWHHPDVVSLDLEVDGEGRLVDARGALLPLPPRD